MGVINIIVAFPKLEMAKKIRGILVRSGYSSIIACTNGAQILNQVRHMDYGIVILPMRLTDLHYREVLENLPPGFKTIVLARKSDWEAADNENVIALSMPMTVHDLTSTVNMVAYSVEKIRRRNRNKPRQRSEEEKKMINQAKSVLMDRNNMSENDAHRYLQKTSMENGCSMTETAQMILSMLDQL